MAAAQPLKAGAGIGAQFGRWLDQRIPPQRSVTLTQRNVFIFPTRTAIVFFVLLVLLLLGAINYQNALIYGTTFLLGATFLACILHTFRNLAGMTVELVAAHNGFAQDDIGFDIRLSRQAGRDCHGLQVGWPQAVKQWVEVAAGDAVEIKLFSVAERRGWFRPGRLLVETRYPLGLLRAWTWVDLTARALAYPAPIFEPLPVGGSTVAEEGQVIDPRGADDFSDLREYQPGDPVRHVLWRRYARNGDLVLKEYTGFVEPRVWFDFDTARGDVERRLSVLTGWVLQARSQGIEFGLRLPGQELAHGLGEAHTTAALERIALYGLDGARGEPG